ncbi:MAG: GMC family oxidoreductase N-terminal domain-containing protein, partial [Deltaproteobacteria bacterium]|nr:GMC family oxidoreductase N-terminal domain-containing protein [Deltaproteobacteria bacterium]
LGAKAMEPLFDRVEERIHAKPQHPSSVGEDSRLLEEGARRLGWRYEQNHRAQDRCVGSNQCLTGCPTGAKQSTLLSYMPRALSRGARCLTEVRAHRLWIEGGRCVGVFGNAINPRTREASAPSGRQTEPAARQELSLPPKRQSARDLPP